MYRTGHGICRVQCKIKLWALCSTITKDFQMSPAEYYTMHGALLSVGALGDFRSHTLTKPVLSGSSARSVA